MWMKKRRLDLKNEGPAEAAGTLVWLLLLERWERGNKPSLCCFADISYRNASGQTPLNAPCGGDVAAANGS